MIRYVMKEDISSVLSMMEQVKEAFPMYAEIFYAVDGYMLKKYRSNCIIPDEIEKEIIVLIDFWKKVYTQEV